MRHWWRRGLYGAVMLLGLLLVSVARPSIAQAATLPPEFQENQLVGTVSRPTAMAFAPDGRLFVTLQDGQVRIYKNGALLAQPFVSLAVHANGERELLGIAFHPEFATNGYIDIRPQTTALTVATTPPGLTVTLDGVPITGPTSGPSVVGMQRSLGVVPTQTIGGITYTFAGWSDGGAASHMISTPGLDAVYTAAFTVLSGRSTPATVH